MAQALVKYSHALLSRIFWPLYPFKPLVQEIKMWQVIAVLLLLALVGMFWPTAKMSVAENLSRWPWSGKWHSQMALVYFQLGQERAAIDELNQAGGHRTTAEAKINQPGIIKQEIASWEKVLEEKKYSKEVLMKLAFLHYLIYEDEAASNYWQQASYLDPTNETIIKLGRVISSGQEP
jgi:Tfp pilus assembly protein PilF